MRMESRWFTRLHAAELLVVFLIGAAGMRFLFSGTGWGTELRPNLAGNDCFYHVKMAVLFPEVPLADEFPWLSQTIFKARHVNHRWGFHAYLAPFVRIAHALWGDYIPGARVAMCVSFGLVVLLAQLILMSERVRFRWMWLALLMALPADFYLRQAYARPIGPSLVCLLLGCYFLLRGRYVLLALSIVLYTQMYLGSFFLVIVAGIHFVSGLLQRPQPMFDWRLIVWVAIGSTVGVVVHPHFPESLPFLETQIFGSGLTPEIRVGREWYAYENVWSFANQMGVPLSMLAAALALRLRLGRRLTRNQWTLLVANFFFLLLTLKARRFVEYWPVFAVLSAATLVSPLFGAEPARDARSVPGRTRSGPVWLIPPAAMLAVLGAFFTVRYLPSQYTDLLAWWLIWLAAGLAMLLVSLRRAAVQRPKVRLAQHVVMGVSTMAAVLSLWFLAAGPVYTAVRNMAKGKYDLNEVEATMAAVEALSQPGDVVFTDDWDIFTVFFYFNDKNYYIVGLDPVFGYRYDPEMRERYVKITRGEAPCPATVEVPQGGKLVPHTIEVTLEDIRDRFNARFVVVDREHQGLARKLDRAADLARQVYPPPAGSRAPLPPYRVYEMLNSQ